MSDLKPQDRVAIAGAIAHAAKELDAAERARYIAWAKDMGVDRSSPSIGGSMIVAQRAGKISMLADDFEAWVAEHQPHNIETVQRVRPAAEKAIAAQLTIVGETVVWKETGEVCDFAVAVPPGDPYVTWRDGTEPKEEAAAWLADRFEDVAQLMMDDRKAVEQ